MTEIALLSVIVIFSSGFTTLLCYLDDRHRAEDSTPAIDLCHERIRAYEVELYGGVVSGSLLTDADRATLIVETDKLVDRIRRELEPPVELDSYRIRSHKYRALAYKYELRDAWNYA